MTSVAENLKNLRATIEEYEKRYHRKPHSVLLLAVTKKQPIEKIKQAVAAGQRAFGENYLQEALTKITALSDQNLEWHFIGTLQRNKTKEIAAHFSWVHTVDNKIIAQRLNEQRPDHLPPLNICIQVNVSHETSKSGVGLGEVKELADYCQTLSRLKLRGLMAIPAIQNQFAEQRKEFNKLRLSGEMLISQGISIDTYSMGMSDDLEAAIAEGATMVRIGTAIFGSRG